MKLSNYKFNKIVYFYFITDPELNDFRLLNVQPKIVRLFAKELFSIFIKDGMIGEFTLELSNVLFFK